MCMNIEIVSVIYIFEICIVLSRRLLLTRDYSWTVTPVLFTLFCAMLAGIAVIGKFTELEPNSGALDAVQELTGLGVQL